MSLISPLHSPATLCSAALGVLLLIYHPAFAGSYSLKAVLPALVPEMTYEGMAVANGQDAGLAWEWLVRRGLDQPERDKIKKALLEYCGQDTAALGGILQHLQFVST